LSFKSNRTNINIDEIISALEQKTQHGSNSKTTDETLDKKPYFTFLQDSQKYPKTKSKVLHMT